MQNKKFRVNDNEMYQYFQEDVEAVFRGLSDRQISNHSGRYSLTSDGIIKIYKSLQVLYDQDEAKEEICLIENTLNILQRYIRIEGMEHLLVNNYAVIENGIFLEHTSEGNPKKIREHYKHQFRNAYLGLLLLKEFHFDDCIESCLWDENGEYASIIVEAVREEMKQKGNQDKRDERKLLKEIVYKSFFVAALFHDIGYPLAYYFRMAGEIHQYTPFFRIINPAVKTDFNEVKALLNNSWLLRTIEWEEIKKKYHDDDHGCLSAVSFLMNFYYSGSVYSLSPKERSIVEMAAVAIYKHTDHFDGNSRMIFSQDPISYLLRLCDDLQEWQRFLVVIGDTHNFLQCAACGSLVRANEEEDRTYECQCGKQFTKITQSDYKKMNYIDICKELVLSANAEKVTISVNYDCIRQLELLLSDYDAVIRRNKGLEEVRTMLKLQKYLPKIELDYFLSNNPIELIEKMIQNSKKDKKEILDWVEDIKNEEKEGVKENRKKFWNAYQKVRMNKGIYGTTIEKNMIKYGREAREYVQENMGMIYSLWEFLKAEKN